MTMFKSFSMEDFDDHVYEEESKFNTSSQESMDEDFE